MNFDSRIEPVGKAVAPGDPPFADPSGDGVHGDGVHGEAGMAPSADDGDPPVSEPYAPMDDAPSPASRRGPLIAVGVGLLALIGVWYGFHHSGAQDFSGSDAAQAPTVSVAVPGRVRVAGKINATGSLAARHEMPVGAVGDGGEVSEVLVNAGDWVRAGQMLAVIDRQVQAEQLANSAANVAVADADARLAEANLQRALKLVDRGFISKANVDQLTAARDAAAARVKVAIAMRNEDDARLHRLNIVAPSDGLVLERDVEPGQVVGPGSGVLFRIAEHGQMEMRARLSEADLAQLSVGQTARITPAGASTTYTGTIWQLSPAIDPQTRQGSARIALAYAPAIRPGGFASAEINAGAVEAPLLPESALQADNQGSYVYVLGPDNRAQRQSVHIGLITDRGVAITAGLTGRERVVLRAGAFLSVGEKVNPRLVAIGDSAQAGAPASVPAAP